MPLSTKNRETPQFFAKFIVITIKITNFASNAINMEDINRIKVVLAEKKRTNRWLAEELGKDPATVSKWCTNSSQPDLSTLKKAASLLDVDVKELLWSTK